MNIHETKALMLKYDIRPTRSLGQNFLVDDRVVRLICETAQIEADDLLIEVGPGMGSLTRALAAAGGTVKAVEIDRHMLPVLQDVLQAYNNVDIIHADALKIDFDKLVRNWPGNIKIAANLPYYITTQLIEKLIVELFTASQMILMMQKEAAERLTAGPGSKLYGPVSVLTAVYGITSKLTTVPAGAYYPQPKIASIILNLRKNHISEGLSVTRPGCKDGKLAKPGLAAADLPEFSAFLNICFSQRRKTLNNVLRNCLKLDSGTLSGLIGSAGLPENVRSEEVCPDNFIRLWRLIKSAHSCP